MPDPNLADVMDALAETRAALERVRVDVAELRGRADLVDPLLDHMLRAFVDVLYTQGLARPTPYAVAPLADVIAGWPAGAPAPRPD